MYSSVMMQGNPYHQLNVHQRAAMQQLSAKVFKLTSEYLRYAFVARTVAIFAVELAKLHHQ